MTWVNSDAVEQAEYYLNSLNGDKEHDKVNISYLKDFIIEVGKIVQKTEDQKRVEEEVNKAWKESGIK